MRSKEGKGWNGMQKNLSGVSGVEWSEWSGVEWKEKRREGKRKTRKGNARQSKKWQNKTNNEMEGIRVQYKSNK